jgi:hypothetical protein
MRKLSLLAAALTVVACSQRTAAPPARISGTYDLALVGDLLFVTSSDNSELRVLDLVTSANQPNRDFVRAPNPLEPLSIPVVDRPVGLARDLRYEPLDGKDGALEVSGPYVYVISAGTSAISIVGGAREHLVELARLPTDEPVTAIAGRGPAGGIGPSKLYFATYDGVRSRVFETEVMSPAELDTTCGLGLDGAQCRVQKIQAKTKAVSDTAGEVVDALLTVPDGLVVAVRSSSGKSGRTLWLNTKDLPSKIETKVLAFPGPVRQMTTHAAIGEVKAGDRIFGVLDEEACLTDGACGGIIAVDVSTGAIAKDGSGQEMLPIRLGDALPRGLSVSVGGQVGINGTTTTLGLLGIATASTGEIFFFDAFTLRHIDVIGELGGASGPGRFRRQATETETPNDGTFGPTNVRAADGAALNESILVIYQGEIPGLARLPTNKDDQLRFPVPATMLSRARLGDKILIDANAACEATVTSIAADALLVAEVPAACAAARSLFTVRAGGAEPYVVGGTVTGYMGRTRDSTPACPSGTSSCGFTYTGSYYNHPAGYTPGVPTFSFDMGPAAPDIKRDDRYILDTQSNFENYSATIDAQVGTIYHLPGSVTFDFLSQRAYIAYPSANGILEIAPAAMTHAAPNLRNIVSYR